MGYVKRKTAVIDKHKTNFVLKYLKLIFDLEIKKFEKNFKHFNNIAEEIKYGCKKCK